MATPIAYKRLFLRGLKWDSETDGTTLAATLKTAAQGKIEITERGMFLVGASANGTSSSFQLPQGSITPESVSLLVSELLDNYDTALAALIAAGDPTPTDDEIYTEMLSYYPVGPIKVHTKELFPNFSRFSAV